MPPLVTTEDDADLISDLRLIKTGTASINPNDRQFYLHPHPQSLHHTTAATAVSIYTLHTFSLISAGASRQAECNRAHLTQAEKRQHGHTDIGQGGGDNNIQLDIVNLDSVQAMK